MQTMTGDLLFVNRLKGSQANVQRNIGALDPALLKRGEHRASKMEACCGGGNRTSGPRIHSLVAQAVARFLGAADVWRQGNMADFRDLAQQRSRPLESQRPQAVFSPFDNFGFEPRPASVSAALPTLAVLWIPHSLFKDQSLSDAHLSSRPHERLPGLLVELAYQKTLNRRAQELCSLGIPL